MQYFVYILKCIDKSYYVGVTNNIEQRLIEHNESNNIKSYTYNRRPVILVFYEEYGSPYEAIEREKQIKGWSRRKKEALINKDFDKLVTYSKSKSNI